MTAQEHLEDRLKNPTKYTLSDEEKKTIQFEGIEKFIYSKVTSKKFRKTKVDEDSQKRVQEAIALNVAKNEPIKFTYPFGGYKIWRVESYPYVDWAEFFVISYVSRYVAPILASYEPGVEFYFSSDDVCIELIDNYPRESLDKYVESFKSLITEFQKYFPKNMKMELKQVVPDMYSELEYRNEYRALFEELKETGLTLERKERIKKFADFNFMMKGAVDYTDADKVSFDTLYDNLLYWSDAYLKLSKRKEFVRGEDKIVLFSNPIPNGIDIGSISTSKAKFWAGVGVLEQDGGKLYERILSPKQWDSSKSSGEKIDIKLLDLSNFTDITTFSSRLNFLKQ